MVAIVIAGNGMLAALPVIMEMLNRKLYLGSALFLLGMIALYAAVLVAWRIRRSREIMKLGR
ncbi:MAG TPA: hypothetical protein VFM17_04470 [Candidatus Eisenbacteria bacterium]|nr:hypothetical protein [Candidatus Eisenbacteria bacterium]